MSTRPATVASEQPGHPDAHRWMGAIAYDLGDMNRALDELSIVSRLAPTDDRPYVLKAQRHADFEQFRDAVEAGSQALALHPPEPVREDVAAPHSEPRASATGVLFGGAGWRVMQAGKNGGECSGR